MLDRHPEHRWPWTELEPALRQIAAGRVPDVVRQHVDDQYASRLRDNPAFFAAFYQQFTKTKEIGDLFTQRQIDMEGQHRKLDEAMANILNYRSALKTSTLEHHVKQHRDMLIKPEHFDVFKASFLGALPTAGINDEPSHDAWCAVLNPALDYMRRQVCVEGCGGEGRDD